MALTQEQWYQKLRSWVPTWWFETEKYNVAFFRAMAAVFAQVETDAEAHSTETYLTESAAPFLDAHGNERRITRLPNETNAAFLVRVRNISNSSNRIAIKLMVDSLLASGTCEIREAWNELWYCDSGAYCDDNVFLFDRYLNAFLILLDPQVATPFDYCDRSAYADRALYSAQAIGVNSVYDSIVTAVNKIKAFGVSYMIVERS